MIKYYFLRTLLFIHIEMVLGFGNDTHKVDTLFYGILHVRKVSEIDRNLCISYIYSDVHIQNNENKLIYFWWRK